MTPSENAISRDVSDLLQTSRTLIDISQSFTDTETNYLPVQRQTVDESFQVAETHCLDTFEDRSIFRGLDHGNSTPGIGKLIIAKRVLECYQHHEATAIFWVVGESQEGRTTFVKLCNMLLTEVVPERQIVTDGDHPIQGCCHMTLSESTGISCEKRSARRARPRLRAWKTFHRSNKARPQVGFVNHGRFYCGSKSGLREGDSVGNARCVRTQSV